MKLAWTVLLPLSLVSPARAAAAPEAREARAVVESAVNSVLGVLKSKELSKEERKRRVEAVVEPAFDIPLMGKLVLGRTYWPKMDEAQRKEYTELFVRTIKDSYYEKIDLFTDETVDIGDAAPGEKGKFVVPTSILSKGQKYQLLYKLYKSPTAWKVYDVEIEGISLIRAYSSQYDQFLQKSTIPGLLAKMKEKTLETPQDLKAKKPKAKGR